MIKTIAALLFIFLPVSFVYAQIDESEHARETLEIYKHIIEVETSKNLGNVPGVAKYLADKLIAAGLPKEDVEIVPIDGTAALIARYRGDGSSGNAPISSAGSFGCR